MSLPHSYVIACIQDHPKAVTVLRAARRRAQEKGTQWRAVFIETPVDRQGNNGVGERTLRLLTLAGEMGGETAHIEAVTVEKGLEQLLKKEDGRIALVVIGSIEDEGRLESLRPPSWMRLVRLASRFAQVEVVPLSGPYRRSIGEKLRLRPLQLQHLAFALLAVGAAWIGALLLQTLLPPVPGVNDQNVALLFMIACAFAAGRFGLLPGLVASVVSFLAVNYYFTAPYQVLKLATPADLLNMGLFLSAALLISLFTSQTRNYAQKTARRERATDALFTLYRIASEAPSREQALEKMQHRLEKMLEADVAFFLPPVMNPSGIEPAFPSSLPLGEADRQALTTCWAEMKTTGLASPFNPGTKWRFEPMVGPAGEAGVLGVKPRGKTHLDAWFGRLISAIGDQTASVLEHIALESSMAETRIQDEREKLRSMLLSSVSHDFKTPLAGIIGALSVHRSMGARLSEEKRGELIEAAIEEAQRLDSFITNILDMTRLESGNVRFNREWHSMTEMIESVTKRLRHRLRQHRLLVHPCPPGIEVFVDVMMTEQVIHNLLDNACKYARANTDIEILCSVEDGKGVQFQVRDHGPGLPAERIERIFNKYERLAKKDAQAAGTGLGLAISKNIMEGQGGRITAANHPEGGAVFALFLPQWRQAGGTRTEEKHAARG